MTSATSDKDGSQGKEDYVLSIVVPLLILIIVCSALFPAVRSAYQDRLFLEPAVLISELCVVSIFLICFSRRTRIAVGVVAMIIGLLLFAAFVLSGFIGLSTHDALNFLVDSIFPIIVGVGILGGNEELIKSW